MDMNQYLQIFIEESDDNLQSLNEHLLNLEKEPNDMQILNEIFRVAHTLKGMAGTMGFVKMQKLTHSLENVLSEIRNGKIHVNSNMLDIMFKCLDALENYVKEITTSSQEGNNDYQELVEALEIIVDGKAKENVTNNREITDIDSSKKKMILTDTQINLVDAAKEQELNVFEINITLSKSCVLKAARAFIVFKELGDMGEIIHAVPEVQDIEDEKFDHSFDILLLTKEDKESVEKCILQVMDIETVYINSFENEEIIETVDKIENNDKEDYIKEETSEEKIQVKNEKEVEKKETNANNSKQQVAGKSVRVSIERLDTLMNLVSELIIVKTQLEGIQDTNEQESENYSDSIEYLERVTSNLHDAVMKVRMVPVETVFNRFPRMIRDISRNLNKDINLVMLGEETELDRTVIDEIGDPLIHLLRNAADHGLETTEERIRAGKDPKGTIKLQAYQDGNSVIIEVIDDGKGIDADKIREKSLKKGLITKEEAQTMSEQEIIELLFKPGFSTSEKITDLSGRGVGLDVVKSKITALGGHTEIKTQLGEGSKFVVRLPLTLAIIQALMVTIGQEKYAIPLGNIQNIEDINKTDIKLVQKQEVIVLRNQVIPILKLHDVLGVEETDKEKIMAVIIKKGEKQIGFIVDALIGQQEIVIKPLGKYLRHINMIAGATILGNGEVALILDINTLV
ncbi:MAG: chemotaxis protein CheW [Cellulosilyticaceae bacterium]